MSVLVDTHCHLNFDSFDGQRDVIVQRALESGVGQIIVPAIDLAGCVEVIALAERFPSVYCAVGIHPNSSAEWQDGWINELRNFSMHEKVVAIGEIGLDYYRDWSPSGVQKRSLSAQLALASELDLPVILHNRNADDDILAIIGSVDGRIPGVLHSFSGGPELANAALDMGLYLGFTGPVTFKKAHDLRELVAWLPSERILVETDAPFLAPHPHRGKPNEPAYVRFTAERIAEVRSTTVDELAEQTTKNAVELFDLPFPH